VCPELGHNSHLQANHPITNPTPAGSPKIATLFQENAIKPKQGGQASVTEIKYFESKIIEGCLRYQHFRGICCLHGSMFI
jgi:hypothetical protein